MSNKSHQKILAIGPLPPPLAGTSVSFNTFCDEVRKYANLELQIINSAPKQLGQHSLFTMEHIKTASRILWQFGCRVRQADRVIIFGSNQFLSSMVPLCLIMAKVFRKPVFIRSFGGSLDLYDEKVSPFRRWLLRSSIRYSNGLIVQTELLQRYFEKLFPGKIAIVPGYRKLQDCPLESQDSDAPQYEELQYGESNHQPLRLVYVGHVRAEKGIFVLLQALKTIANETNRSISCDIYGPVYTNDEARFFDELAQTPNVQHKGILDSDAVIATVADYDVFVFPTFYEGEGHPGVLVEAIIAGLPIITTDHRSIPEIVEHELTGLIVAPQNVDELKVAITRMDDHRELLADFRRATKAICSRFDAKSKIRLLLQHIGVDVNASENLTEFSTLEPEPMNARR